MIDLNKVIALTIIQQLDRVMKAQMQNNSRRLISETESLLNLSVAIGNLKENGLTTLDGDSIEAFVKSIELENLINQ